MKEMKETARKLGEETARERERESVCLCASVCVCWKKDFKVLAEQKAASLFLLFFLTPPKLLSLSTLPSDYSSVSAQRQPGLLDSVGHR